MVDGMTKSNSATSDSSGLAEKVEGPSNPPYNGIEIIMPAATPATTDLLVPITMEVAKLLTGSEDTLNSNALRYYADKALDLWQASHDALIARNRAHGEYHKANTPPQGLTWDQILHMQPPRRMRMKRVKEAAPRSKMLWLTPTALLRVAEGDLADETFSLTAAAEKIGVGGNSTETRRWLLQKMQADWCAGTIRTPFDRRPAEWRQPEKGKGGEQPTEPGALVFDGTSYGIPSETELNQERLPKRLIIVFRVLHLYNPSRKTGAGKPAAKKATTTTASPAKQAKKRGRPGKAGNVMMEAADAALVHLPQRS